MGPIARMVSAVFTYCIWAHEMSSRGRTYVTQLVHLDLFVYENFPSQDDSTENGFEIFQHE